jgi:hypothetical protein
MVLIMNSLSETLDRVFNDVIGQNHVSKIAQFRNGMLNSSHLLELLSRNEIDSRELINNYDIPYFSSLSIEIET